MTRKAIHDPIWRAVDALGDASSWLQSYDLGQVEAALDEADGHIRQAREALESDPAYGEVESTCARDACPKPALQGRHYCSDECWSVDAGEQLATENTCKDEEKNHG